MSYTSDLQNNNVDLQAILDKVNKLPSSKLPELNNPADSSKILEGYESVDDKGNLLVGSMPNQGSKSAMLGFGEEFTIAEGYHDGTGKVTSSGLPELSNPAGASQILSGYEAILEDGSKVTGTIASQAAQTITPGTSNKTIAAGKYLSGKQTIKGDSNLKAANILKGVSIFGVAGSVTAAKSGTYTISSNARNMTIDELKNATSFVLLYIGSNTLTHDNTVVVGSVYYKDGATISFFADNYYAGGNTNATRFDSSTGAVDTIHYSYYFPRGEYLYIIL